MGPAAPGSPLECDLCHRAFQLEDLRSGRAEIREARVLCPRCIARLDRKRPRFDYRFVAALVFILAVFPVAAGALVHFAMTGKTEIKKPEGPNKADIDFGTTEKPGPSETPASAPGTENPSGIANPEAPPASPPSEVRGIAREDLRQIVKNLRESRAGASEPGPLPPALPPSRKALAPRAPRAPGEIGELIASDDPSIRLEGILRIAREGGDSAVLLRALNDEDPFVRSLAATALGQRREEAAIGPLLGLIRDPVFMVRKAASQALVDAANLRIKFAEDFSKKDLERLKAYLEDLLRKKSGSAGERSSGARNPNDGKKEGK
jgi:hypothetical protein